MNKVILIDADSLLYKNIEDLTDYQDRIDQIFSEAIAKSDADYYRIFIETPNNYTFRKILNPEYKSKRTGKPLPHNYHEIKQYIIETYNPALAVGIETDDYIVSTLKYLSEEYPLTEVVVCANDKDYKTIPMTYMDLYYGRYLDTSVINEDQANRNFAIQMLMGDAVDNVVGLKKVGVKKAEEMIGSEKAKRKLMQIVWLEYLNAYKNKNIAKAQIKKHYQLLRLRDNVKSVKNFDKVMFE
jgi:hypothetical protein